MSKMGRLNKQNVGYGMPSDAPLYGKPPFYYTDLERLAFSYETDEEAVLDILPEGLEVPTPATATLLFFRYPFSTLGPYLEVILSVACLWEGSPCGFIPHIVVDSDQPQAAGREILGYPKKMAHITLEAEGDMIIGTMERPRGNRICTGVMRLEQRMETGEPMSLPGVSLRIIPNPEDSMEPSLMQLIETRSTIEDKLAYTGPGFAEYNSASTLDPWHRLTIKKLLHASYARGDMVLPHGKVIKTY